MNNKDIIFNEIFSSYYKVMREITNAESMSIKELQDFISSRSSDESSLFLLDNLNNYFFLKEIDGKWESKLGKEIVQPLTKLEKSWLKEIISDPKFKLFVDEEKINKLNELLGEIQPLFDESVFHYFDQTMSSDEYLSEEYVNKFKTLKKAIEEKKNLVLDYTNIRNENYIEESVPLKLEYSLKNNKFRLLAVRFRKGKKELKAYNVKQINKIIEIKENTFENINRNPYADEYCEEPVKILVHNTRGAIMRFMTEFSTYKKESIFDDETGDCTTTFYYHSEEKPEIINKILSFGVAVKVLSPSSLIDEIKARIKKQIELLDKMENNPIQGF